MTSLFSPINIGAIDAPNRIFMAPLTRCRAPGHIPTALMATHYAQRASAGLIIAEATMVMEGNGAFTSEPGIYSSAQVAAWRTVTDAVHAKGGRIVLQLWHGGRACHPLLNGGAQPVAPSAVGITASKFNSASGPVDYAVPRALREDEVHTIVDGFRLAAINARDAGFDGVEVHGANGYLIDQFLRDGSNKRTDRYGGSAENRSRFLLEVLTAVCGAWDPGRVGLRISPLNSYNDMIESDPAATFAALAARLNDFNLAFLHLMRADFFSRQQGEVVGSIRAAFKGPLVANMGYSAHEAAQAVADGSVDAVAFGKAFIANPDLVERIKCGAALNDPRPESFYSGGAEGYTDYPALDASYASCGASSRE